MKSMDGYDNDVLVRVYSLHDTPYIVEALPGIALRQKPFLVEGWA